MFKQGWVRGLLFMCVLATVCLATIQIGLKESCSIAEKECWYQVPESGGETVELWLRDSRGVHFLAGGVYASRGIKWRGNLGWVAFVKDVKGIPSLVTIHLGEIYPPTLYEYPELDGAEVLSLVSGENSTPYQVRKTDGTVEERWFS